MTYPIVDAATGATGPAGADGASGVSGFQMTWSSTTTMADPGAGNLRYNNATAASVTAIAIDSLDRNSVDVDDFYQMLDDVATSSNLCWVMVRKESDPTKGHLFRVTGFTDQAGWVQLTVVHESTFGALTNADEVVLSFMHPSSAIDHGGLAGLTDDDHSQYVRSDTADTVAGKLTFTAATGASFFPASGGGKVEIGYDGSAVGFLVGVDANTMRVRGDVAALDLSAATRIEFRTAGAEEMRITSGGNVLVHKTSSDEGVAGVEIDGTDEGKTFITADGTNPLSLNRLTDDGILINFKQAGTAEGNITVSGTSVSLTGAHLARWSQLPGLFFDERPDIKRGTVMSAVDERCQWFRSTWPVLNAGAGQKVIHGRHVFGTGLRDPRLPPAADEWHGAVYSHDDNEQLMRCAPSTVIMDCAVYGIFDRWDDDPESPHDDPWPFDFFIACTGDFLVRVTGPCEQGDLLISNGDGTATRLDPDVPMTVRMQAALIGKASQSFPDIGHDEENPELVPVQLVIG